MRMVHYFAVGAGLTVIALLAAAGTGILQQPSADAHLSAGLVAAVVAVGTHTLLILFMIVTGRVLREAMGSRPLGKEFLGELNAFFARKKAYPLAGLSALAVVATAVLGYGQNIGVPSSVHMLLGVGTVLLNLWALQAELRALAENQVLIDRVSAELDRIDREHPEIVAAARAAAEEDPEGAAGRWLAAGLAAWLPYLYWGLIEWRGDFHEVPLWLPIGTALASAYALLCAWLSRGAPAAQR